MHRAESDANAHIWVISALGEMMKGSFPQIPFSMLSLPEIFSKVLWLLSEDIEGMNYNSGFKNWGDSFSFNFFFNNKKPP